MEDVRPEKIELGKEILSQIVETYKQHLDKGMKGIEEAESIEEEKEVIADICADLYGEIVTKGEKFVSELNENERKVLINQLTQEMVMNIDKFIPDFIGGDYLG